jgi:hypothetical protein
VSSPIYWVPARAMGALRMLRPRRAAARGVYECIDMVLASQFNR